MHDRLVKLPRPQGAEGDVAFADLITVGAIVILLALQLSLALRLGVNWDEFHFLSQVHAFGRGELDQAVNSIHVHLFGWLRALPGGEVEQVIAGRLVMLVAEAGTALSIVAIARRFMAWPAALAAAVLYLSFDNVLTNGASFRTDPLSTLLLMAALLVVVRGDLRWWSGVAVAVLVACAMLVTIKSVFYLPTLGAAALWRITRADEKAAVVRLYVMAVLAAVALFAVLFAWHKSTLLAPAVVDPVNSASSAYRKTLQTGRLFPEWVEIHRSAWANPLQSGFFIVGPIVAIWRGRRDERRRWDWWMVAATALPLATLAFYRNAFPYFYAFMLAPVCIAGAAALASFDTRRWAVAALATVLALSAVERYVIYIHHDQGVQRAVVDTVHRMFPHPVPYVERASMIGSFPDVGFFMTTWGVDNYLDKGKPIFPNLVADRRPRFVIASHPALVRALSGEAPLSGDLLPQDRDFLRDNYIPHWGPIWVAGKRLTATPTAKPFRIAIAGIYVLEASAPVIIDNTERRAGDLIVLGLGVHSLSGRGSPVVLRLGPDLYRPASPPPAGLLYWGF